MSVIQKKKDYLKKKIPKRELYPWNNRPDVQKTNFIDYSFIRQVLEQDIDNLDDEEVNQRYKEKVRPLINKFRELIEELDI